MPVGRPRSPHTIGRPGLPSPGPCGLLYQPPSLWPPFLHFLLKHPPLTALCGQLATEQALVSSIAAWGQAERGSVLVRHTNGPALGARRSGSGAESCSRSVVGVGDPFSGQASGLSTERGYRKGPVLTCDCQK